MQDFLETEESVSGIASEETDLGEEGSSAVWPGEFTPEGTGGCVAYVVGYDAHCGGEEVNMDIWSR